MFSSNSLDEKTCLIPFPPPPAVALIMTGNPNSTASFLALVISTISPELPGIIGTPASIAAFLALILSPINAIVSDLGPTKIIPADSTADAKKEFSARNP